MKTVCQLEPRLDYPSKSCQRWAHTQKMHKCELQLWKGILALPEAHCPLLVLLRMQCQWGTSSAARTWMERENQVVVHHVRASLP